MLKIGNNVITERMNIKILVLVYIRCEQLNMNEWRKATSTILEWCPSGRKTKGITHKSNFKIIIIIIIRKLTLVYQ